jgi:hypothetical protein
MKNKGRNSNYKYNSGGGAQTPPPFPKTRKAPTPEELQEKLEKSKKRFFRRAPFLLVIIVLCVIMIKRPQAPDMILAEHSYASFYSRKSGETVVIADGRALAPRLNGGVLEEQTTLVGSVYAVLTADAELRVFSPEGAVVASEENAADFALAADGGAVAYYSTDKKAVMVIDIESSERTEIPDSADAEDLRISPDGGAAAFVSGDRLYLWSDGVTTPLGEGLLPLAASNEGERVYAVRRVDDMLCIFTSGGVEELVSDVDTAAPIVVSRDSLQLIVNDGESTSLINGKYVYRIGGEGRTLPVDIFTNSLREPFGFAYKGYFFETVYATQNDAGIYSLYAVSVDGTSKLYVSGSESEFRVRLNGGSAYYVRKGELNLFQNSGRGGSVDKLDENISTSLVISGDSKRVFYISNTGELRTLKGKGAPGLIAEGAATVQAAPGKNNAYYTTLEGTLYYYDSGKTVKIAENVADFTVTPHMTYYYTLSDGGFSDVYASADGISFALVAEGV